LGFPLVAPRGGEPITYLRVRRPLYLLIFQQQIQSCVMVRDKELHAKTTPGKERGFAEKFVCSI
jgi:hypothetical protein